jgi:taurine dioxygenase
MDVRAIDGAFGVEIRGVDVSGWPDATIAELKALLARHHLVAIRDQHLTVRELGAFARRLGPPQEYPFAAALPEDPFVVPIVKEAEDTSNFGGIWHTDSSYLEEPPGETMLYAVQLPRVGGDTLFADMQRAFESLSAGMQRLLEGLTGEFTASLVHSPDGAHAHVAGADRNRREAGTRATAAVHPVVRTHPVTGRKGIYASLAHTYRFSGFTRDESLPLIEYLQRHATREEFCTRLVWGPGTLAIWDNRAVQHYPLNDYPGERRVMHRVILAGERPK